MKVYLVFIHEYGPWSSFEIKEGQMNRDINTALDLFFNCSGSGEVINEK